MWGDKEGETKNNHLVAVATMTGEEPNLESIIYYNPKYLAVVPIRLLKSDTAHESYHLWQGSRFPNVMGKTIPDTLNYINHRNSMMTWAEIGARKFAQRYMRHALPKHCPVFAGEPR